MDQALDNLQVFYTYHVHEGDAVNGGGCYTKEITEDIYESCTHRLSGWIAYYKKGEYFDGYYGYEFVWDNGTVDLCTITLQNVVIATGYADGRDLNNSDYIHTHDVFVETKLLGYDLNCGKTTETIESATIIY